jgi:3-oxoacyl-[acyl-carrier protein] reductase
VDVRVEAGKTALDEIRAAGGEADLFAGDVSRERTASDMVRFCLDRFGRLDILINNAGLRMERHNDGIYEPWRCVPMRPTHELAVEDWDLVLNVNLRAVFLCTRNALPPMIERRRGTIIGISSNAGSRGVAGKSAYCASKHALEGLMKTVAAEVKDFGVSANAIHPGGRVNVDGRGGNDPEIVVPLVLHLCSQDRPATTGATIRARDWNRENSGGIEIERSRL